MEASDLRGPSFVNRPSSAAGTTLPTLVLVETYDDEAGHRDLLAHALPGFEVVRIAPPVLQEGEVLARVSDWVRHTLERFDEFCVDGGVLLGGWSFGGVVALETARELQLRGADVRQVVLLDTSRPRLRPLTIREAARYHLNEAALLADDARARRYLRSAWRNHVQLSYWRTRRRLAGLPLLGHVIRLTRTWRHRRRGLPVPSRDRAIPDGALKRSIHRSYLNYRATWCGIPVALVSTTDSVAKAAGDPTLGWAPFLRAGYELAVLECTHAGMWEEPARGATEAALAAMLRGR